jgi:hypothetical protein
MVFHLFYPFFAAGFFGFLVVGLFLSVYSYVRGNYPGRAPGEPRGDPATEQPLVGPETLSPEVWEHVRTIVRDEIAIAQTRSGWPE